MGITSLYFLLFFGIVILLYYCLPVKTRWISLLISNMVYMVLADEVYLVVYPIITITVTWICARRIESIRQSNYSEDINTEQKCKRLLLTAIICDIGVLAVLKYLNLGVYTVNAVSYIFGANAELGVFRLLAPLGISFYTLSIIGYILDVYYGIENAEDNYFKLFSFGTFFPLLISGPIVRYKDTGKQICEGHRFDYKNLTYGAQRALWGFFKVLVISERLAVISDTIFDDYKEYSGIYVAIAAIAFTLRLYTNFSGSMDIVLGLSLTLGIKLPENFKRPFFSQTVQEFWQRWHITLGEWLRDYILYSTLRSEAFTKLNAKLKEKYGKKKAKHITTYLAMMILWLIAGIWHGGAWKYIWGVGLLQGIYIITGEMLKNRSKASKENSPGKLIQTLRRLRTFILISFAFLFFRASSLRTGFGMIGRMFCKWNPQILFDGSLFELGLDIKNIAILAASLLTLLTVSILQEKESICDRLSRLNIVIRWCILFAGLFAVIIFGSYGPGYDAAEFIYQGF